MNRILVVCFSLILTASPLQARPARTTGLASWYGESHRGRFMANGARFNPDKLTAASWFYPLGTKVQVTVEAQDRTGAPVTRSVMVTITDRGPALDLVRAGRIIDLGAAAFKKLAHPDVGLIQVRVNQVSKS